jgi:hypothetical protein
LSARGRSPGRTSTGSSTGRRSGCPERRL